MCEGQHAEEPFVLTNMDKMLDSLTRGLDLNILTRGYGVESRGVTVSYQCQSPVVGLVLPSNSPGVHTLWLPVIPLQVGLVLKPGSSEPWTPYRITAAFFEAGIPREAISIYPGGHDVGPAVLSSCDRSMIFGGTATIEKYKGNPKVQAHGPGFSKILLGDDIVDDWPKYLDVMVQSVYANSGRGCINASGIWASRHTKEIAAAIAEKIGPVEALPPDDPKAGLAAFTDAGHGAKRLGHDRKQSEKSGVTDMTEQVWPAARREGTLRLSCGRRSCTAIRRTAASRRRNTCSPSRPWWNARRIRCWRQIGPTLVGTAITKNERWIAQLTDAMHIDRLNIGPIPTIQLNWLQPHEGNIIDFLFRNRAYQDAGTAKVQ